ncbi:MAG: NADH-quinone oxidoreductase subunit NuoI [bacterium]|nr:NADH-quinone oxidoreductase subunit NuoI [bacterium]
MFRIIKEVFIAIPKGMFVVFKQMFHKPVTVDYPFVKPPMAPRYRGLHFLERYDDGSERCVCCGLCAASCPADAIYMEPAETERGERYAKIYEINELRCIFCGFCEEACPEEAIFLGKEYEFASDHRDNFIYTKDDLLVKWPRTQPSEVKFLRPMRRVAWQQSEEGRPQH